MKINHFENCGDCANLHKDGNKCRTMVMPFDDHSCKMDSETVKKVERAIRKYNLIYGCPGTV